MTEWKEYTGSDEQDKEMENSKHGYILNPVRIGETEIRHGNPLYQFNTMGIKSYLICNPHPLKDMIIRQTQTGQPVWVRYEYRDVTGPGIETFITTTPDWNIPGAEYRFTPFEDKK